MITRIAQAIIVGVAVGLLVLFLGVILSAFGIPPLSTIAGFLIQWCWVIGILAGLWQFFSGGFTLPWPKGGSQE
jgi:hypothetical protein